MLSGFLACEFDEVGFCEEFGDGLAVESLRSARGKLGHQLGAGLAQGMDAIAVEKVFPHDVRQFDEPGFKFMLLKPIAFPEKLEAFQRHDMGWAWRGYTRGLSESWTQESNRQERDEDSENGSRERNEGVEEGRVGDFDAPWERGGSERRFRFVAEAATNGQRALGCGEGAGIRAPHKRDFDGGELLASGSQWEDIQFMAGRRSAVGVALPCRAMSDEAQVLSEMGALREVNSRLFRMVDFDGDRMGHSESPGSVLEPHQRDGRVGFQRRSVREHGSGPREEDRDEESRCHARFARSLK